MIITSTNKQRTSPCRAVALLVPHDPASRHESVLITFPKALFWIPDLGVRVYIWAGQEVKPCFLFRARILFCLETQKELMKAAACFGQDDSGGKDLLGKEEWGNHGLIMGHPSFRATPGKVIWCIRETQEIKYWWHADYQCATVFLATSVGALLFIIYIH